MSEDKWTFEDEEGNLHGHEGDDELMVFCEGCGTGFTDGMMFRIPDDDFIFLCESCHGMFKGFDVAEYLKKKKEEQQ